MRKFVSVLLAVLTALTLAACGGDGGGKPQVPFEVGTDTAEYTVDGAAGWTVQTTNVNMTAGPKGERLLTRRETMCSITVR